MSRAFSIIPHPAQLKLLMDLLLYSNNIISKIIYDYEISDFNKIAEVLPKYVKDDKQIRPTINTVKKLLGKPHDNTQKIEVKTLEQIVQSVSSYMNLLINENDDYPYWEAFTSTYQLPKGKLDYAINKYYYSIRDTDKILLDEFVTTHLTILTNKEKDNYYYSLHYWSPTLQKIHTAVLIINENNKYATLEYYRVIDNNVEKASIQSTHIKGGLFRNNLSVLILNFIDINENKNNMVTNIIFAAAKYEFNQLPFLKGTYSSNKDNGTKPVCGVMIAVKQSNYDDIIQIIQGKRNIEDIVCFELLEQRIEITPQPINDKFEFEKSIFSKLLSKLKGIYVLAFIKRKENLKLQTKITKGVCEIFENGIVRIRVGTAEEILEGSILNETYYSSEYVQFKNYIKNTKIDNHKSKYQYNLKLSIDVDKTGRPLLYLYGIYSGIEVNSGTRIRSGKIIFIKSSESNINFSDVVSKEIPENGSIDLDMLESESEVNNNDILIRAFFHGKILNENHIYLK